MKIEATARQIRVLLQLAQVDRSASQPASKADRESHDAVASHLPRRLLDRYELLREVGRTPVVVAVEHGTCSGCHLRLPAMVECKTHRTPAIHTCPHCRRMLYAPELVREDAHSADRKPSPRTTAGSAGRRA